MAFFRRLSPETSGVLMALLATFVWSFNFIYGRGLIDDIPPCTLATGRWGIAFLALLPFALPALIRERRHFLAHIRFYLMSSFIGIAYFNTAIYAAAHYTPALTLSLIACTAPIFTILLSRIFLGEPIHPARVAGICVALLGIVILLTRGDLSVLRELTFNKGELLMLSGAFGFAVYTFLLRKRPEGSSTSSFLAVNMGLGLLMLIPCAIWEMTHGEVIRFNGQVVSGLLYMGLGASLLCYWWWGRAIALIGPSKASTIYYLIPLFCGIEAVLLLGERANWTHLVGGILILGGLILATREPKRLDRTEPAA